MSPVLPLLLVAFSPLADPPPAWEIGGGLILGTPALTKVTDQPLGISLGAGRGWPLEALGRLRLGATFRYVPGRERDGLRSRLTALSVDAELSHPTGLAGLEALLALEGHRWRVSNQGTERRHVEVVSGLPRTFPDAVFALREGPARPRLGLRVGLLWQRPRLAYLLAFHLAEAGGGEYRDPVKGPGWTLANPVYSDPGHANRGPVNPGWFEVGIRWRL